MRLKNYRDFRTGRYVYYINTPVDISFCQLHDNARLDKLCVHRKIALLCIMYDLRQNNKYEKIGIRVRGYVRKYFNVQSNAFLCGIMRDFYHFCVQFLSVNQIETNRCEIRAFHVKIMCNFCI